MSYLIPSSIFKTVFGKKLRSYIKPYLQEIYDYTQDKMFDDALVKSAIIIINKSITNNEMIYYDMNDLSIVTYIYHFGKVLRYC